MDTEAFNQYNTLYDKYCELKRCYEALQAENAKLKELLGRYGRHDCTCEQSIETHPKCICGWGKVAQKYLEE